MFSIFTHNLARIAKFSGRTRPGKFWPYVAGVIVGWFLVGMAMFGVEFVRLFNAYSAYASDRTHAAIETTPEGFSIEITGDHPELIPNFDYLLLATGITGLCVVFLLAAAVARRLHDRNMSGLWGLLPLPFLASGFYFMTRVFDGAMSASRDLTTFDIAMFFAGFTNNFLYLATLAILIVFLAGKSTPGDNRFGPQPPPS